MDKSSAHLKLPATCVPGRGNAAYYNFANSTITPKITSLRFEWIESSVTRTVVRDLLIDRQKQDQNDSTQGFDNFAIYKPADLDH